MLKRVGHPIHIFCAFLCHDISCYVYSCCICHHLVYILTLAILCYVCSSCIYHLWAFCYAHFTLPCHSPLLSCSPTGSLSGFLPLSLLKVQLLVLSLISSYFNKLFLVISTHRAPSHRAHMASNVLDRKQSYPAAAVTTRGYKVSIPSSLTCPDRHHRQMTALLLHVVCLVHTCFPHLCYAGHSLI